MSVIEEVRNERKDLASVLKKHTGIRKLVEDLYPDNAHFIFELLQNAEDRNATEVRFRLSCSMLRFEHNGETFSPQDIWAITDIGEGTKTTDEDKIGRFGVGFKSVFAYSETPRIWSPTFSFEIAELVLPSPLSDSPDLDGQTRFDFPFNNPKKSPPDAYKEIESALNELAETTLLFLRHIESIKWNIEGGISGDILRIEHSDHHVEMLKQIDGKTTTSSHFLKLDQPVSGLERQSIAIAFAMEYLPNVHAYSSDKLLSKQLKIVPAQGQVAVFFPAAKETSGLRFHLHAPFVPELSRASIKETPANKPLFDQIATLATASLHLVRDNGLLTTDFLGVLPNPQDPLGQRYAGIRDSIIGAMDDEPLTPTYAKGHAPARLLVQARASLKELVSPEDLEFLIDYDDEPPQWAASRALQGTNTERFMNGLAIRNWDVDAFVECVVSRTPKDGRGDVDTDFVEWLTKKNMEWHQQFYALLARESDAQIELDRLKKCQLARLVDGTYSIGSGCYFSDDGSKKIGGISHVDAAVYTSGKSKSLQDGSRKFLADIGVTAVGERQRIEAILKGSYIGDSRPFNQPKYIAHLRRFMKALDVDRSLSKLLSDYPIFFGQDDKWHKPSELYLDNPYIHTGLEEYVNLSGRSTTTLFALSPIYRSLRMDMSHLVGFAMKLGCRTRLSISKKSCRNNPKWKYLEGVPGERFTNPIDVDFAIPKFEELVARKSLSLARLVWNTMCGLSGQCPSYDSPYNTNPLRAVYRKNERGGARFENSILVHQLRNGAWVPQRGGDFVCPADAHPEQLPDGFIFDPGSTWIKAIEFGKNIQVQGELIRTEMAAGDERRRREQEAAKALGFTDVETARRLAEIPPEELTTILSERERRKRTELPDQEPTDPGRRFKSVSQNAINAPERHTESRERSVSVTRDGVKVEADQYLRQQYTNADNDQYCQICKDILPFKLDNGSYFFEAVELMAELSRHHYQNYLCLCPNHSAMFRYANGSCKTLMERIGGQTGNEVAVVLAQQEMTLYFTKTHLADIKSIISAEEVVKKQ